MKNIIFIFSLFILISCSRTVDDMLDSVNIETKKITHTHMECFSGGSKFFEIETTQRIWIQTGGHYMLVEKDRLITITGDCVLQEYF